jgi:zinc D-Ala-D-Ala carboxypeptidase
MKLSEHVTLNEFCNSNTANAKGINNTIIDPTHLENAKRLALNVFEPLRSHVGHAININSGYRSAALNKAIPGSSSTSQHCFGEAIDLDLHDRDLFEWIIENITFDQMIFEGGTEDKADWFHISYRQGRNRKEVLRMVKKRGKSTYLPYIKKSK